MMRSLQSLLQRALPLAGVLVLPGCLLQQARIDTPAPAAAQTKAEAPARGENAETAATPEPELTAAASREQTAPAATSAPTPPAAPPPPADLWQRLRAGLALPPSEHPNVEAHIAWFERHQSYLDRVAERATPYLHEIVEAVEARGVPMEIALLPVVESAFQPFAYSHGRAAGLWQFVPGTGRRFGLKQTWWYDGRRDVLEATRAALDYLEYLHGHFDGNWLHALAAYNSGEGTVQRAIKRNRKRGQATDFWSLDLPRETRGYVPRLLALAAVVKDPGRHGLTLEPIANEPVLTQVDVGSQIDLDLAAQLAGLEIEELYRYNPAYNRWATDPDGPHTLLLPRDNAEKFQAALESYPPEKRIAWERHRIRNGESLNVIARRYHTTVALLQRVNDLRGTTIRAGDSLIIPVARTDLDAYRLSADQRRLSKQNKSRDGRRVEYVVQSGDTLWDISRQYRVGVRELAGWNSMAPADPLRPGQRLVIWTRAKTDVASLLPASFKHPAKARQIGYTVRRGDSLARISQKFRVSVADLRRWNNLQGQRYLQPGQSLTLFVDVTEQSGAI